MAHDVVPIVVEAVRSYTKSGVDEQSEDCYPINPLLLQMEFLKQ